MFYQMQQMFGHLMESRLQAHEPEKFWQVFKLWGQQINIHEQQDSFDFFQAITDQVDEHMKVKKAFFLLGCEVLGRYTLCNLF